MTINLKDLAPCFQGIAPSLIATCGLDGEPNVTYLSQVYYVDESHVALSCQFFNKTRRNVDENPYATVVLYHPVTFEGWRLCLRFLRSEVEGPLFDTMAVRIQVIASHTGMTGVFRLLSADVYEVISVEALEGLLLPADPVLDAQPNLLPSGPLTEIRGVQVISERITRAQDLDFLLTDALTALDELLGFSHSMVLLLDECSDRLVAIATRGYGSKGIGGEVPIGHGLIGTVAEHRRMVRVAGMRVELRYGRAIRGRVEECGEADRLAPEIPLPGLPDAQAQLALPLLAGERLLGVLVVESRDPLCFDEWDEAFLQILGNQIAMGIDRMQSMDEDAGDLDAASAPQARTARSGRPSSAAQPAESFQPAAVDQPAGTLQPAGAAGGAASAPGRSTASAPGRSVAPSPEKAARARTKGRARPLAHRSFVYYPGDESIFVDDEYLIRNVPAKILWRILGQYQDEGRTDFSNRELRLDPFLGLPPIRDNLESRLILLRKRLAEKCPEVRLVSRGRGRLGLEVESSIEMLERGSP